MQFNTRFFAWVALATLIGSGSVDAIPSSSGSSPIQLKARHHHLHAKRDIHSPIVDSQPDSVVERSVPEVPVKIKKRSTKKCPAKNPSGSSSGQNKPLANVESGPSNSSNDNNNNDNSPSSGSQQTQSQSRLDKIRSMYAFSGFVHSLENCQSTSQLSDAFSQMKAVGARTVITFGYCPSKDQTSDYQNVIKAAGDAGLLIIPLIATLVTDSNPQSAIAPRARRIAQAIINHPDPVLALAYGDETLYDNDLGSPSALASQIYSIKGQFKNAGLDIPISISDMAYGYQSAGQKSSNDAVPKAVDFFMINTFPYFGQHASWGGNEDAFTSFKSDISFFESISSGKPLLVTQTGWPSNKQEFAPNSNSIVASTGSSEAYWNLLDGHCSDFFKKKNIGWIWRSWDDTIAGWGVNTGKNQFKFNIRGTKTSC